MAEGNHFVKMDFPWVWRSFYMWMRKLLI